MTESSSTTKSIPACRNCEYFREDEYYFTDCKFHYFETADYVNGKIKRIDMSCVHARENEKYCGHEGKNFKQRQVVVEEKKNHL